MTEQTYEITINGESILTLPAIDMPDALNKFSDMHPPGEYGDFRGSMARPSVAWLHYDRAKIRVLRRAA